MRQIGIEIAGDYGSGPAIKEAVGDLTRFDEISQKAAASVEKLAAQRANLQQLAAAYKDVAAQAADGSDEQLIALKKVSDAEARLAAQVGETGVAMRSASTSVNAHTKALGDAEKEARGGIASFTGLGRAMFFASNAFLGGALIGGALKGVVDKTRDTELAMDQLKTAVRDSGSSWGVMGNQIDAALSKQEQLSQFTRVDLATGLDKLILSTGSVTKGEQELAIATDLARLKNEDLTTATQQVAQAGLGHTTVLRGLQIAIPAVTTAHDALKNELAQLKANHEALTPAELAHANALAKESDQAATGARALDILAQKTSGADATFSKSGAGGLARFQRSLEDLEVSIGKVLMPDLTAGIDKLSAWMDHMDKTGQAQKDAKEAADALSTAIKLGSKAIGAIDDVTGSFKNTLELLIAIKASAWALGLAEDIQKLIGSRAASTGIAGAEVEATGLYGALGKLKALGPIGLVVALSFVPKSSKGQSLLNDVGAGFLGHLPLIGGVATQGAVLGEDIRGALGLSTITPYGPTAQGAAELAQSMAGGKPTVASQIKAYAAALGLDPNALLAVASAEGGFGNAIGGNGTSFGPFQLHKGGALPSSLNGMSQQQIEQWATSAQGLQYAVNEIAKVAKGLTGMSAVRAIVTQFERPADGGAGDISRAYRFLFGKPPTSEAQIQNGASSGGGSAASFAASAASLVPGKTTSKKPGIVSGVDEIPEALKQQIAYTATMAKQMQGEAALEWVANESDSIKEAKSELQDKLKGQSGKQAAATQKEIDTLDKQLANLSVISGAQLLPQPLKDAISKFKTDAVNSTGKQAATYLEDERDELDKAVAVLKGELVGAKGKQAAAIRKELDTIDGQVATVNKQITDNLKAQAAAIKSNAASAISSAKQGITSAFSQIISDADQAFENDTQSYITDTLGPEFYQGTQNPLEAQLAAMQAADTASSLADTLKQAKAQLKADLASGADATTIASDKKAVAQAQRAIQENQLSIQATQLRAQEDAAYAAAVKQYTDERALEEKRMNTALEDLSKGIGDGTKTLDGKGGLNDVLAQFGLTASVVADDDMKALATATAVLAKVFADEAAALGGVGSKAAQKAAAQAEAEAAALGGGGSSSGGSGAPGRGGHPVALAMGGDIRSEGLAYLHRGERVLPSAVVNALPAGGGPSINMTFNIPNYVGDKRDLAAAIKSPQVQEAVAMAVILASRGGHIRQGDIRS